MTEKELREFEESIVKGANVAFRRLVSQKKKENGELMFSESRLQTSMITCSNHSISSNKLFS